MMFLVLVSFVHALISAWSRCSAFNHSSHPPMTLLSGKKLKVTVGSRNSVVDRPMTSDEKRHVTWAHAHHAWGEYGGLTTVIRKNLPFQHNVCASGKHASGHGSAPRPPALARRSPCTCWKNGRARVHALLAAQLPPTPNASGLGGSTGEGRGSSRSASPVVCVCVFFCVNDCMVDYY